MSGVENITDKIISQAQTAAKELTDSAKAEYDKIIKKANLDAAESEKRTIQKANEKADEIKKRMISVAELDARKMRLSVKQDMVQECFNEAQNKLCNLPKKEYIDLLASMVFGSIESDCEILLNDKDRSYVGEDLVGEINTRLSKAGSNFTVKLSQSTVNVCGGFVLKSGNIEYNSTMDTVVRSYREELTPQIITALFE